MCGRYPTTQELKKIRTWDVLKEGIAPLMEYIQSIWNWPDLARFDGVNFELHTGGWSGNEDIVEALQRNHTFWAFCWVKSERGGHYWFELPKNAEE